MRNRLVIVFLLPVIIFLWLIGWSALWLGSDGKPKRLHPAADLDVPTATGIILEHCIKSEASE